MTGLAGVAAYLSAAGTLVLGGILFASGVGLLKLRNWGARLARTYAVAQILWSALAFLMALVGPFARRPDASDMEGLRPELVEMLQAKFTAVSMTLAAAALVLSVVFPVVLLCLLSRDTYKQNLS
jgi:hypothetical protein